MKKIVLVMMTIALAVGGYPQERADVVEAITPSSLMLFMKTSRIKKFIETVRFAGDNLLSAEYADKYNKTILSIKAKTGIDPLDIESLKNAGIDVERSASLAIYPDGKQRQDRVIIFLPVLDEKTFPLKFVEILKKMSGPDSMDLYPAITDYRGYKIFQSHRDIFFTALDGVLAAGSTGELIRSVIDAKADNAGYLALDPMYNDYLARARKECDLKAYATRDFLKHALRSRLEREREKENKKKNEKKQDNQKIQESAFGGAILKEAAYIADAAAGRPSVRPELERLSGGASLFNSVDYAFMGATVKPEMIDIDFAARFNTASDTVNTLLQVIKTGTYGRALHVKNAATYSYISFDYNKIESLCKKDTPGCAYYHDFTEEIRDQLGIDFGKDVVPYSSGVLNIIAGQPKGAGGGYLFFMPMDDPERSVSLWDKSSGHLKEKYKGTNRFGTAAVGGVKSFWYIDSKNNKNHVVFDRRGIYIGNDVDLIATALSSKELSHGGGGDEIIKRLGDKVFFLAYVKKESFFGALLMIYAYRNRAVAGVMDKMTDLVIIGEKADNVVSFNLTVRLAKRK
ncbi:MAG: hypothetical protein JW807_04770 [Spirochaetes bacterium]|nr:hypothetical protein [Spirochaetota bacterium]